MEGIARMGVEVLDPREEIEEYEEIIEDEESYFEEEVIEDEELMEDEGFHVDEDLSAAIDDGLSDSGSGSGDYMDDDSSAPPQSINSDLPDYDDNLRDDDDDGGTIDCVLIVC